MRHVHEQPWKLITASIKSHGQSDESLLPVQKQEEIYLAADTIIVSGDTVFYIKPQAQRLWLLRQAHRDAERIVQATLKSISQSQEAA